MNRPYLNADIDSRYHLSPKRDGCLGLWGDVVFLGNENSYRLKFKQHSLYPIAQAEAYPALEITLPLLAKQRNHSGLIQEMGLHPWLADVVSRSDLLERSHNFLEQWKIDRNQLIVIVVWYRDAPDWTIIPDVVTRLTTIADTILLD